MAQYLLSVCHSFDEPPPYHTYGELPPAAELAVIFREVEALNQEIKAAGVWVFGGGLHPPSTATVARLRGDEVLTTDGPFAEGKEHIGGFWVIQAPDLDAALAWAAKATRACRLPVEVRPFQEEPES